LPDRDLHPARSAKFRLAHQDLTLCPPMWARGNRSSAVSISVWPPALRGRECLGAMSGRGMAPPIGHGLIPAGAGLAAHRQSLRELRVLDANAARLAMCRQCQRTRSSPFRQPSSGYAVASSGIGRIDDETLANLRFRPAAHGLSVKDEVRRILGRVVGMAKSLLCRWFSRPAGSSGPPAPGVPSRGMRRSVAGG